jgi:hypothetical protein
MVNLGKFLPFFNAIFMWQFVIVILGSVVLLTFLFLIFWFMFSSSLQQNQFLVILPACQSILPAKSSMQKCGMRKPEGEHFFSSLKS